MNLVARRTEFGGIRAHKRLQKSAAVRLRIEANHKIVELADERTIAGCELMQLRIFQEEVALAHGAFDLGDAVAHEAAETGAGFRATHDLLDRGVKQAAVEERGIVATGAPFRGTHAGNALHVLDALAVPLIVEGGE